MTNDSLMEIIKCAKEVFCNGIYVPCREHPCGWDFISFECIEPEEISEYKFNNLDISNGIYDAHPYEWLTLKEILQETNGRYEFEIENINW